MELAKIETFIVDLPKRRAHNWAGKTETPIGSHLVVRLVDDGGNEGWGEAPAIPTWGGANMRYYGETPESGQLIIEQYLWPAVKGLSPVDIELVHRRMDAVLKGNPYAKSAVEVACLDLAGKVLGIPASGFLGGRVRNRVQICHSLGLMEEQAALEEAEAAVAEGIRTIKVKTGVDPQRDVRLSRLLRERLGPDVALRADANEGYQSVSEAVRITERMVAEADIFLCEQPLAGTKAIAEVAHRVSVAVMADEAAWTPQDILELAEFGGVESFSLYFTKPGGLLRAREQAVVAEAVGLICDIGGSIEMGIANAANLQLGAAVPIAHLPSVCPVNAPKGSGQGIAGNYYSDDLVTEPFQFEDGSLVVPSGPGLGVEVDEEKVKAYAR